MPVPDAKTRHTIGLNPSKAFSSSRIPSRLLPKLLVSNLLYAISLHAGKHWLLEFDVGVFWVTMRILACGGIAALIWEGATGQLGKRKTIEWSVLGTASVLLFVQQASLFTALFRLSSIRVILFAQFAAIWVDAIANVQFFQKSLAAAAALVLLVLTDTQLSAQGFRWFLPGYVALVIHALSSSALEHTQKLLIPSLGTTFTIAATTLGAAIFSLPFYIFRVTMFPTPPTAPLSLISLSVIPVIACSLLYLSPIVSQSLQQVSPVPHHFSLSFPVTSLFAAILGPLAFARYPSLSDLTAAALLYFGLYPQSIDAFAPTPRTPTTRLVRSYLKTILSNQESRKIFYFLMLNMSYMLVQMLYGVWTNSLGLISDAIHMAFDCMAIAVGLFASVMATWEPNERFTYGYGRIETLSGFANGIFLILISIFIVFEAIQRILEPPEMNTSQLLLVSSLGLAVNLFGMFAMGGHHHHGHSHGHGHGHGHDTDPSHSHDEAHHTHSHQHSPPESPPHHAHSHDHSEQNSEHAHCDNDGHTHTHSPTHSHSHSSTHSHSHSPNGDHAPAVHKKHKPEPRRPQHLILKDEHEMGQSPITPNYRFGFEDPHYTAHHLHSAHLPNANDPATHAHSHEGHSHNMRGVFLHVMADTLGSVGVIISTLLIQFYGWTGFDPIASLFIATLISASVIPLVLDTGKILALGVDGNRAANIQKALAELGDIEGLASYTQPRFWPKDASTLIGSIHIQVLPSAASHDPSGPHSNAKTTYARIDRVVERVDSVLRDKIKGLEELTIQVEKGNKLRS